MPKPKAFKKSNAGKQIRVCKKASASEAIGKLEKNTDTFILTYGQFSLMDGILAVMDQTGPAHINISTWTAAAADLTRTAELVGSAEFLSFRMIVDRSFKTRQPQYYDTMVLYFGQDSIREINTHAKFVTIRNDEWNVVIRTSMNLNGNPRLENMEISENKEFAEFFESIVNAVFSEVQPGKQTHEQLELSDIPDSTPFKLVSAKHIKRGSVNEPRFTHTIE